VRRTKYSPHATSQLEDLYEYVALASGPDRANTFVGSIVDYCDRLATSPHRGTRVFPILIESEGIPKTSLM